MNKTVQSITEAAASGLGKTGRKYNGSWTGVVVSAGKMEKTVKVQLWDREWNKHVQKFFNKRNYIMVHDPNNSIRQGDVISIAGGWRTSTSKRHVVRHIIAPYGEPIEARPPVPSEDELKASYLAERVEKLKRRYAAQEVAREARLAERAAREARRAARLAQQQAAKGQQPAPQTSIDDVD